MAIQLSKGKLDELKLEYKNLYESLLKDNEEQTARGGWLSSLEQAVAFDQNIEAKRKRVNDLKNIIDHATILPEEVLGDKITIGKRFVLKKDNKQADYRLVDPLEASPSDNLISINSPLGKELYGKSVGDTILLGLNKYSIIDIV